MTKLSSRQTAMAGRGGLCQLGPGRFEGAGFEAQMLGGKQDLGSAEFLALSAELMPQLFGVGREAKKTGEH